jgi:UDP-N-acetylglucosamine 1-carboxyvinyltransferase
VPHLHDVTTMIELLGSLASKSMIDEKLNVAVSGASLNSYRAPYDLVKTNARLIHRVGTVLAAHGKAKVLAAGRLCNRRTAVDQHLKGLSAMAPGYGRRRLRHCERELVRLSERISR